LGLDRGWRKNLVSSLLKEDLGGSVILDLGTGTGDLLFDIEGVLDRKDCSLIGMDFSSQMLNVAYEKWQRKGSQSSFLQADASALPLVSNSVHRIVSAFVMRNIKKVLDSSLLEIKRVLKHSGKVSILEMYVPQNFVLKALHRAYLNRILPLWGRWICGSSWSGDYLPQTILEFGSPDQFSKKLEVAGFREINYRILLGGVAVLHTATK